MWRLDRKLPDGHRLFLLDDTSHGLRYAIADDSGTTPDQTDDGVLWLDTTRPLSGGTHVSIPLIESKTGNTNRTPSNMPTLLMLAAQFDWSILIPAEEANNDRLYEVKEVVA